MRGGPFDAWLAAHYIAGARVSAAEGTGARAGFGGVMVVVFAATVIALSFVLARLVYDAGSNPLTLVALRYPAVILMIWGFLRMTGRTTALPTPTRLKSYGVGAVYFAGTSCYLASILYLPVSLAVLVFYTYPLMTVVFESALRRRLPRPLDAVAFLAAFAGLALALEVSLAGLDPRGIAFALVGAAGASASFVWAGRALAAEDMTVVTFHMSVCGAVVAAVLVLASGSFALPSAGLAGWGPLVGTILCFAVAFLAMFTGVKLIGALRTSMIMNLEPVATIVLAVLLLGERLTAQQLAGGALVIGAVLATQMRAGR